MRFIKSYKIIWIQCFAFVLIGIYKHQPFYLWLSLALFVLPFILPEIALFYLALLEKILDFIGFWIKNILFFLLYFLVFFPVSLMHRVTKKSVKTGYHERNKNFTASDFKQMW